MLFTAAAVMLWLAAAAADGDGYDRVMSLRRANRTVAGMRPCRDGEHYTVRTREGIVRRSYADRTASELLWSIPFAYADYLLSPDEQCVLIADAEHVQRIFRHSYCTDWWLAERGGQPHKILEGVRDVSFSPDGSLIAYARDNNLYLCDLKTGQSRAVTSDGRRNSIICGTSDWVYEEEFGFTKAYSFSPDGRTLAWLRFDETQVPTASLQRYDGAAGDSVVTFKYPRAGQRNSTVTLHLFDIASGTDTRIDTGSDEDQYILHPSWTAGNKLCYYRINRRQNMFEALLAGRDGQQKVIYEESSPLYVERPDADKITFTDALRFIVREETSEGWMHLYLHDTERGRLGAITSGQWEVTSLVAADGKHVWYMSTECSPLRRDLYRARLDGKGKTRLTAGSGYSTIAPGAGMKYYVETLSDASTPNIVTVHRGDGRILDTLADSRSAVAAIGGRQPREFFTFVTERGDTLNAYRVLPAGFDPSQRYPVLLTQYSGPGSQSVADRWSADWEDALAQHGYIVVCADGRGTGFRGERFKKSTYRRLGELEVEDQISFARHMASQPWVDAERIGIYGWSYGGFTSLGAALRGQGLFRMAIAVAPVTSWRYYDSVYTETYNGLPGDNPSGYDDNSPVNFAHMLDQRTRLLIMHGTADDNVHPINTMQMVRALTEQGKRFELVLYPDQNHSMQPDNMADIRRRMITFTLENL